jgi:hypothetical protein
MELATTDCSLIATPAGGVVEDRVSITAKGGILASPAWRSRFVYQPFVKIRLDTAAPRPAAGITAFARGVRHHLEKCIAVSPRDKRETRSIMRNDDLERDDHSIAL